MISVTRYWFYIALIVLVYIIGMFATLFENDSAQFAVMAMRMVQENDFLSLFKGPEEYLDKPHMHYWLAALSYKIFGMDIDFWIRPHATSCFDKHNILHSKAMLDHQNNFNIHTVHVSCTNNICSNGNY